MTEWRVVADFPDYEVSDHAEIRRLTNGRRAHSRAGMLMKLVRRSSKQPHLRVKLTRDGVGKLQYVSRLMCIAFHGEPPTPLHQAAHNNGNPLDNTPQNVVWKTPKENADDIECHGRRCHGEKNPQAKLNTTDVLEILRSEDPQVILAERFGVTQAMISLIKRRKKWKHIEGASA